MSGERIGLLGGTFDPIHLGHLIVAEEARTRLSLDRLLFVPSRQPWRKAGREIAPEADRLAMVRLAVEGNPGFEVSLVDLERAGPSYSVDTVCDVRATLSPEAELYFILGYDALMDLPHWHAPDELARITRLVTVIRPGYALDWSPLEQAIPEAREAVTLYRGQCWKLETPEIGISSTEVRQRVAAGRSIRYWVPDLVAEYIQQQGLYRGQ